MSIFQGIGNRGGNRGGRDQFNWDDVRGDKYKDYYLGQSVNLQKRWWLEGKNQVGTTKAVLTGEGIDKRRDRRALEKQKSKDEIAQIKQQEQFMFMQEMGILPKGHYRDAKKLEKHEFKEMCKRGTIEKDENDVDRMGGIGFSQVPALSAEERVYYREDGDAPTSLAQPKDEFVPVGKSAHVTVSSKKEEKHSKKEKKSKKDKKHKKEKKEKKKRRHESDEKDKGHKRHKRDEEMDDRRDGRRHKHDSEVEKDSRRDAKNSEEKRRHDSDEERLRSRSYRHDSDEERSHRRRHDSDEERSTHRRERHDSGDEDNSKTRATETRERRRHDSEERPTHRRERHDSDEERPTHRRERHDSDEE